MAEMKRSTWTRPDAIRSRHSGYSPAEAHEPWRRTSRVTTDCSGSETSGARFPTSVTQPPLRTAAMAPHTVGSMPTASKVASAPRPSVSAWTSRVTSVRRELKTCPAPSLPATASRSASRSTATMRRTGAAFRTWTSIRPMRPAPKTATVSSGVRGVRRRAWTATETGSAIAACSNVMPAGIR